MGTVIHLLLLFLVLMNISSIKVRINSESGNKFFKRKEECLNLGFEFY